MNKKRVLLAIERIENIIIMCIWCGIEVNTVHLYEHLTGRKTAMRDYFLTYNIFKVESYTKLFRKQLVTEKIVLP